MTRASSTRRANALRGGVGLGFLLNVVACARPGVDVMSLPNGAERLRCQSSLPECLAHADALCKGASYEVLYAKHERSVFGTGQSQVEGHASVAEIHCLGPHEKPLPTGTAPSSDAASNAAGSGKPPAASSAAPVSSTPPSAAPPPQAPAPAMCVPGATQTCVGPGACAGGQSCLPDGSGFGACDCGKS
jgi:hypothetical protein